MNKLLSDSLFGLSGKPTKFVIIDITTGWLLKDMLVLLLHEKKLLSNN